MTHLGKAAVLASATAAFLLAGLTIIALAQSSPDEATELEDVRFTELHDHAMLAQYCTQLKLQPCPSGSAKPCCNAKQMAEEKKKGAAASNWASFAFGGHTAAPAPAPSHEHHSHRRSPHWNNQKFLAPHHFRTQTHHMSMKSMVARLQHQAHIRAASRRMPARHARPAQRAPPRYAPPAPQYAQKQYSPPQYQAPAEYSKQYAQPSQYSQPQYAQPPQQYAQPPQQYAQPSQQYAQQPPQYAPQQYAPNYSALQQPMAPQPPLYSAPAEYAQPQQQV